MPLLKRSPFKLADLPKDLQPDEEVYTIRFTKEVFRDYGEYLQRMHMYCERKWACKVTGKVNLTYEEALASEEKASKFVENFPEEFIGPVLRKVQFSRLSVSDLVDRIHRRYKDHFVKGETFEGVSEDGNSTCRILKAVEDSDECDSEVCSCSYDVAWLKSDGSIKLQSTETVRSLRRKKHPLTKNLLKSFIRIAATIGVSKKSRWAVHENFALDYNIPLQLTEDQEDSADGSNKENKSNGQSRSKRKEYDGEAENGKAAKKRKITDIAPVAVDDKLLPEPTEPRPVPHSDEFLIPGWLVGDMLMAWSFCNSFSPALDLTSFSLEDFQRALLYEEGECNLLAEVHHALIKPILQSSHIYEKLQQFRKKDKKGKKKSQILPDTWRYDVADVLEIYFEDLKSCAETFRLGEYAEMGMEQKVDILRELVDMCLNSPLIRAKLDEHIPKRSDSKKKQALDQVDEADAGVFDDDDENDEPPPIAEHIDGTNGMVKSFKRKKKPIAAVDKKKEETKWKCPLRNILLGDDRSDNLYWFFPRERRLFIESEDSTTWSYYNTKEEFEAFLRSLNTRGIREKALKEQIEEHYDGISETFDEEEDDDSGKRKGRVASFLRYINLVRIDKED